MLIEHMTSEIRKKEEDIQDINDRIID